MQKLFKSVIVLWVFIIQNTKMYVFFSTKAWNRYLCAFCNLNKVSVHTSAMNTLTSYCEEVLDMAKSQKLATLEKVKKNKNISNFLLVHNAYWFKTSEEFLQELDTAKFITELPFLGCFPLPLLPPPPRSGLFTRGEAIATVFSVFTQVILSDSVDNAHNWQIVCSFNELTAYRSS